MAAKKILIIGASGHAKVIIDIVKNQNLYEIIGLIDSFKEIGTEVCGYKVLGSENDIPNLMKTHNIYGGIIGIGDNWKRMFLYHSIIKLTKKFKFITAIHSNVVLGMDVHIGKGTVIMAGSIISSDSIIGDFCVLNTISSLGHDSIMDNFSSLAPGATIGGGVKIGVCTSISLGARVIENIKIGKHTVIGAGAVVVKNVGDYKVSYGVPAKEIRTRVAGEKYLAGIIKPEQNLINEENIYSLETHELTTNEDLELYKKILISFNKDNLFYSIEFQNSPNQNFDKLGYFILNKNDNPIILMPFNLRKIDFLDNSGKQYFDISSPYGYSGPLINDLCINKDLIYFWKKVDSWYKKNNIVTEFIRFSLNGNHINYSGHLISSLSNVQGEILNSEEQWENFKPKVRNNYRKALKEKLTISIFRENISLSVIDTFYNIYISTMLRNNASNEYFNSKEYFENLILNNSKNIIIAMTHKDDVAISTELIFIIENVMYSYLGGTLKEYFNMRPNDFLKIEMINWARKNNISHYILGGGRTDGDSLYNYKKSFFPNDLDAIFYTGRKVVNKKLYFNLIKQIQVVNYTDVSNNINDANSFFPIYRQNNNLKNNSINQNISFEVITSKESWREAIQSMDNYDFYHTYDYHILSKNEAEQPILLKYTEDNIIICLPLLIRKVFDTNYYDATSVYGYAGPLQKNVPLNFDNTEFKKLFDKFLNENKIISVFSRLNPFVDKQYEVLDQIGDVRELSKVVNINLTQDLATQRSQYSKSTKSKINQLRRLCTIKISNKKEDLLEFINIYHENMERVNAKDYYFFDKKYFEDTINGNEFKTDIIFIILNETNETISASMMVKTNDIIQYHLSGTKNEHASLSPSRLAIDEMRIKGTNEKFKYFNLGGGIGNAEDSLFRFKSSFSKDFKPFKIWKYIVNEKVYQELNNEKEVDTNIDFFPLYRYTSTILNLFLLDLLCF